MAHLGPAIVPRHASAKKRGGGRAHSEFGSRPRALRPRVRQPLSLEDATVARGPSYPGGHFGGNQLLASSIGLSPLYLCLTIDLHVRTVAGIHQSFPRLLPAQA